MKKNTLKQSMLAVLLGTALLLPGCGADDKNVAEKDTTEYTEAKSTQIADASEMAETVEVVDENMVPIHADQLLEGTYPIAVDSSSTMFRIVSGELKVEDGQMFVTMTMGGTGYRYLFMGTGEQAVEAGEEQYIPFVENTSGEHTFTVPVEALDAGIDCAAFSNNKEKWYDRTLVFRADSLPLSAFAEGVITTATDLELDDGEYTVEVTLEGGSGKTSVESPAKLIIRDQEAFATIVFSSKNYDYMLVNDVRYDNETPGEQSSFTIPVAGFDCKLAVVGDTTAMSEPHEIDYTLYFESDSIHKTE